MKNTMLLPNQTTLLHLSLISGVGPAAVFKILKYLLRLKFPGSATDFIFEQNDLLLRINLNEIYDYKTIEFERKIGLSNKISKTIYENLQKKKILEEELMLLQKYKIDLITILDTSYPVLLRQIHLPPTVLYIKGRPIEESEKRMAFVGARKANLYGKQITEKLIPEIVSNGWAIVSGGATGADTMAHEVTLSAEGKTIVILGSGLLQPYPPHNKELFKKIVRNGGTLVSPFPLNYPPDKTTFPARNRIIAGLSKGIVVVQAAERSGALITAEFALEQGRQVFAIPGSIFDELSIGCHKLLSQGAKLVTTTSDILDEYEFEHCKKHNTISKTPNTKHVSKNKEVIISNLKISSENSNSILSIIDNISTLDELSCRSGLTLQEIQNMLFELQLENKVKQNFAGAWELVE
jgi:DNA processing protein